MNVTPTIERLQVQSDWLRGVVELMHGPDPLADADPTTLVNLLGSVAELHQLLAIVAAHAAAQLTAIAAQALGQ